MATEKGPSDVRSCSQLCRLAGLEPSDTGAALWPNIPVSSGLGTNRDCFLPEKQTLQITSGSS
ncbi:mCG7921 [Mus musculus]|nr:mCG7921 [Mus musculus]